MKELSNLYKAKTQLCVFLHSNNCGPCKMFAPVWDLVLNTKKSDMHFVKIEIGKMLRLSKFAKDFYKDILLKMLSLQNAVPNIAKYNPVTNRVSVLKKRNEKSLTSFIS
jgi:thiol-disulfide isomerase/thioredoxin